MLLNQDCVIVDLETTGTNTCSASITEYGCLQWDVDGHQVTFQQLINPRQSVPQYITQLTGINNRMLMDKPSFEDIASQLHSVLSNRIFIAHNVRFDYAFLKNSFSVCQLPFAPKLLCTFKLARQLYPQWSSYSLENICKEIGYQRPSSHRAMADVLATKAFIDFAIDEQGLLAVNQAAEAQLKQAMLPKHLDAAILDAVANTYGVYRFYDNQHVLLYVGKSKHMQNRVMQHFQQDIKQPRVMQMTQQIASIETTLTGGELSALLLENHQIKTLQPLFNRRQRRSSKLWSLHIQEQPNGYMQLVIRPILSDHDQHPQYGIYRTKKLAKVALDKLIKQQSLCHEINTGQQVINYSSPCFARQLKQCHGACEGKEDSDQYNLRLKQAVSKLLIPTWPYSGPIAIIEKNLSFNIASISYIDQWSWLYSEHMNLKHTDSENLILLSRSDLADNKPIFDRDTYLIIKQALKKNLLIKNIA